MKKSFIISIMLIAPAFFAKAQTETLYPVQDIYFKTFGGGEGKNTFMKFDISSVPQGSTIYSVYLMLSVYQVATGWDGDCRFMNVQSQDWDESYTPQAMMAFFRPDTILQPDGFATVTGWATSADLKELFQIDYSINNQFFTLYLKDPDDPTFSAPVPGTVNSDSLMTGNIFNDYIKYSSSETNNSPRLIINYGPPDPVSIAELSNSKEVGIYPNPVKGLLSIDIKFNERMPLSVDIIDIIGNIIISQQTYNGGIDISKLPKGMYFLRITYQNQEIIKKLVKE